MVPVCAHGKLNLNHFPVSVHVTHQTTKLIGTLLRMRNTYTLPTITNKLIFDVRINDEDFVLQ